MEKQECYSCSAKIQALAKQNRFLYKVYWLLMFILINELSEVFYVIGTRLCSSYDWNFVDIYPGFAYTDCMNRTEVAWTWEAEIINPVIATFLSLGQFGILNELALFIIVLKVAFKYYRHDERYTSIIIWSLKALIFNSLILILGILPHTKLLQRAAIPIICTVYYINTVRSFNDVSMVLRWVCNDLAYEEDVQGKRRYRYHVQLRRTFQNFRMLTLLALFLVITAEMVEDFKDIVTAVIAPKNEILYNLYGLRIPTIFHTCKQQLFFNDYVFGEYYSLFQIVLIQLALLAWFGPLTCVTIKMVIKKFGGKLRLKKWPSITYAPNYEKGYRLYRRVE